MHYFFLTINLISNKIATITKSNKPNVVITGASIIAVPWIKGFKVNDVLVIRPMPFEIPFAEEVNNKKFKVNSLLLSG